MIEVCITEDYEKWFSGLRDRTARSRIDIRIRRITLGNFGDVKAVGEGVSELRIDHGPGYRVYFVMRGEARDNCRSSNGKSIGKETENTRVGRSGTSGNRR